MRKIQARLLPPPGKVNLPAPVSAWVTSQACYDVGGDAYDVLMLPSGEVAFKKGERLAVFSGSRTGIPVCPTTGDELKPQRHRD